MLRDVVILVGDNSGRITDYWNCCSEKQMCQGEGVGSH